MHMTKRNHTPETSASTLASFRVLITVTTALLIATLITSSAAHGLTLGDAVAQSALGSPLRVVIPIAAAPGVSLQQSCFRVVSTPGDGGAAIVTGRVSLERAASAARLVVTTQNSVNDPAIRFSIEGACDGTIRRVYVLLLDPPVAGALTATENTHVAAREHRSERSGMQAATLGALREAAPRAQTQTVQLARSCRASTTLDTRRVLAFCAGTPRHRWHDYSCGVSAAHQRAYLRDRRRPLFAASTSGARRDSALDLDRGGLGASGADCVRYAVGPPALRAAGSSAMDPRPVPLRSEDARRSLNRASDCAQHAIVRRRDNAACATATSGNGSPRGRNHRIWRRRGMRQSIPRRSIRFWTRWTPILSKSAPSEKRGPRPETTSSERWTGTRSCKRSKQPSAICISRPRCRLVRRSNERWTTSCCNLSGAPEGADPFMLDTVEHRIPACPPRVARNVLSKDTIQSRFLQLRETGGCVAL